MELRHLRYFVAVAEERHITRAAARLGIQQPPLSQQIRALEAELQVRLLRRKPRGIELTQAGEAFFAEARQVLQQADRAVAAARRTARGEAGRIGLGFTSSASSRSMPPSSARRSARQPGSPFIRCSRSRWRRSCRRGTSWPPAMRRWPWRRWRPRPSSFIAGFSPRIGQEAPRMLATLSLVAAGLGVTLVPQSMQRLRVEGVAYRSLDSAAGLVAPLNLAYRPGESAAAARRFIALVRRGLADSASAEV
jgi:DNA-binding transcriptional LysR family regulator